MNTRVKDVMTRYAVAVHRGASFRDMAARLARDMVRKIRHVQGVVAVRDRLGYPPD